MKIQTIRKLCLAEKVCRVLTGQRGQQWIGGRDWMCRVDDGLSINREAIRGLFDLDQEQMEKLRIEEGMLEGCSLWPVLRRTMNPLKVGIIDLNNMGGVEILGHDGVVYLAEKKKIKAAVDSADYREYLLAWDKGDNPLIVIRDGMIFAGVVRPLARESCKAVLENMLAIGQCTAGGTEAKEDKDYQLKLEAEGGQQLDMDEFDVAEGEA